MLNLQKKHIKLGFNLFILTIFLSSFSFGIFAENYRLEKDNKTTTKQSNSFHFNTDNVDLTKEEYMKWRKAIERSDENNNGLSDALEKKAQGTAINDQKFGEKHDFKELLDYLIID